eukprot:COSAG01_NODE_2549_length_7465_cov_5.036383_1_plen_1917_part_00
MATSAGSDTAYDSVPEDDEDGMGIDEVVEMVLDCIGAFVEQRRSSVSQLLKQFDRDKSGDWDHGEFEEAMRHLGFSFGSINESRSVFARLAGSSGRVGQADFAHHMRRNRGSRDRPGNARVHHLPIAGRHHCDEVFERSDAQRNGYLSLNEVANAVQELYPNFRNLPITQMAFKAADDDNNGRVNRREFRRFLDCLRFLNKHWTKFEALSRVERLNLERFKEGCARVLAYEMSERIARAEFTRIAGGSRSITFEDFCKWAARRSVGETDYSSPRRARSPRRSALAAASARPLLSETLHKQNRFKHLEQCHVVIDARFEDGYERLSVAVYDDEQAFRDAPARPDHRFDVAHCVVDDEGQADGHFTLKTPNGLLQFKSKPSQRVATAVRACQFAELVCGGALGTGWSPDELASWLEFSNNSGLLDEALAKLRAHNVPGMHFAKLSQPDMREKFVLDLMAMVQISNKQASDVTDPLKVLQVPDIYVWLQTKNSELDGQCVLLERALRTWELHHDEQSRYAYGGGGSPRGAVVVRAQASSPTRVEYDDELEDEDYGTLLVTVVKAHGIPELSQLGFDRFGPPTMYAKLSLEDQVQQTAEENETYTPEWNSRFRLRVTDPDSVLFLDIYNANKLQSHLHYATLKVPMRELDEGSTWGWYRLENYERPEGSDPRDPAMQDHVLATAKRLRVNEVKDSDGTFTGFDSPCPKGAIQLRFQYVPPELAVDLAQPVGRRVTMRRGAIVDIERFIGAYAADTLDVEAKITQGLLWSSRYVVVTSIWPERRGQPERERFMLMTYKDQQAWDDGAEPLAQVRLGESQIGLDSRPESRNCGFFVKNRSGSVNFRAARADAVADWMTALRALQFTEMISWNGSYVCRWLEAQGVSDSVLHNVHNSNLTGDFFARTIAAGTYVESARELQSRARIPQAAANEVMTAVQDAQLGTDAIRAWLPEVDSDLNGKAESVRYAVSLFAKPSMALPLVREVGSTSPYRTSPGRGGRSSPSRGPADDQRRALSVRERLEFIRVELNNPNPTSQAAPAAPAPRFSPQQWKEEQDRKLLVLEQKKLQKELADLERRKQQTRPDMLQQRFPRGQAVYNAAQRGPTPNLTNVKSKYKKEARRIRDRDSLRDDRAGAPGSPRDSGSQRGNFVPMEKRDPKIVSKDDSGELLAVKLESLINVHRNLQEHEELTAIIIERLRQSDARRGSELDAARHRREQKKKLDQVMGDLKVAQHDCMVRERMVKALQEANEMAMEKEHRARDHFKEANRKMKEAQDKQKHAEDNLQTEVESNRELKNKLKYSQRVLQEQKLDSLAQPQQASDSEQVAELKKEVEKWKTECKREKRNAIVAKHEATERGKLLVGAAAKLELESEKAAAEKKRLTKKLQTEKSVGFRQGQQEANQDTQDLTRQLENATQLVFDIANIVSFEGHHRFKDADEHSRADLIGAVQTCVDRWEKQRTKLSEKDKEIRKLKDEVKELRKHLEREQAESFKMLEELHTAKSMVSKDFTDASLTDALRTASKLKKSEHDSAQEIRTLENQVSVHSVQLEAEQRRTAQEKEKNFALQLELRRVKVERESATIAERERSSEIVRSERDSRAAAKDASSKLRERQQHVRLQAMQAGSEVSKHHARTLKTDSRYLCLSEDGKSLIYSKDRKNMTKGKRIPVSDIRAVHVGFASDNLGSKYTHMISTPEWHCFSIVLRTRTVDFSTRSEEDAALWVIGLRTLMEWNRGDSRGREVGRFLWQRVAMRTRHYAKASDKNHIQYLAAALKVAGHSWVAGGDAVPSRGTAGSGGFLPGGAASRQDFVSDLSMSHHPGATTGRRVAALQSRSSMSPGMFSPRALSPMEQSLSPMERLRAAGDATRTIAPMHRARAGYYARGRSPAREASSPLRSPLGDHRFGSNERYGSPRYPTPRTGDPHV